jgi:hypothetical protein
MHYRLPIPIVKIRKDNVRECEGDQDYLYVGL